MIELRDIALNHAILTVIGGEIDRNEFPTNQSIYDAMVELADTDPNTTELPGSLSPWQPLERWSVSDLLNRIDDEADSVLSTLKTTLEYAHAGLIQAAIDDKLSSDANEWHLDMMVEAGLAIERGENDSAE